MTIHRYFLTAATGLAELVATEVEALGGRGVKLEPAGVRVRGPLQFGYRLCMGSRCASRVVLLLHDFVADDDRGLYDGVASVPWEQHIAPSSTLAVSYRGRGPGIVHTKFGAQRVKDAIVDRLRDRTGSRPAVDLQDPDVRVAVFQRGRGCTVGIDLSGEPLHRRGYRGATGPAPLKETLAAAMLMRGGWPNHRMLVDPMCGSGTIAIEAALMAAGVAPGRLRERWGFDGWLGHDRELWSQVRSEAEAVDPRAMPPTHTIVGFDSDATMIAFASESAARAGVDSWIRFEQRELQLASAPGDGPGLLATNPPYGERLADDARARASWAELGQALSSRFVDWPAVVLLPADASTHVLQRAIAHREPVRNGPLECQVVVTGTSTPVVEASGDFANRLRKNAKHLAKWARRNRVTCYRVYDADMPDYAVAIDRYEDALHVQEYAPPDTIEPEVAQARLDEVLRVAPDVLGCVPDRMHLKVRRRQRGRAQYERQAHQDRYFVVHEGGLRFWVNLQDYLDTGLFLDHRITRGLVRDASRGRRVLNLFAYTGSVTVYAADGGAASTTSVDLSNTYLDWCERNLALNAFAHPRHELVRADVLGWIEQQRQRWDLVFLDPPTFSNSKAMRDSWDVLRDHAGLIERTMRCVERDGQLWFSTNAQRFKLADDVARRYEVEDITARTIDEDFRRSRPHRCFVLRHRRRAT